MTHALAPTTTTGATSLGDRGASHLRTVVPVAWGTVVAQLLALLTPHLPGDVGQALADWLAGDAAIAFVTAAVIALWYAAARLVEPHIPDWLTRLVLGSAAAPTYARTTADGQAVIVTSLPVTTGDGSPVTVAALPVLGDPAAALADQQAGYDFETVEVYDDGTLTTTESPR